MALADRIALPVFIRVHWRLFAVLVMFTEKSRNWQEYMSEFGYRPQSYRVASPLSLRKFLAI